MGYPSTAQLPNGKLITVFYAVNSSLHDGYHVGAIGWVAKETTKKPKQATKPPFTIPTH